MPRYYGVARRPHGRIGQVWIDADRGRPTRQFWTGVTHTTDREAGEDTARLNQQTPIPVPDGPLEESDLAAAIRRVLQG
jgi:hypothetical protein